MAKKSKNIIIVILFCLLFLIDCRTFAIEETDNSKKEKLVSELIFDEVIQKAVENSYDVQMADFDIIIAKYGINEARAEYFPKLIFSLATEYNKNYKDHNVSSITVGESVINPYTRFQTLGGVTVTYNLFDFGVRGNYYKMAKTDKDFRELIKKEDIQKVKLTVIELYGRLYILNEQIKLKKEVVKSEEEALEIRKRLYKAREISLMELQEQRARVDRHKKELANLKGLLEENLIGLAFFTNDEYDYKKINIQPIGDIEYDVNKGLDYEKSISNLIYNSVIKKKKFELTAVRRTNYPKINAYTKYYMYGSDPSSYPKAFDDFSASNWAIGTSLTMMAFDGGKVRSKVKQLEYELKKIEVEKAKTLAELKKQIGTLKSNLQSNSEQLDASNNIVSELSQKEQANVLLVKNRVVSPLELYDARTALLTEQIDNMKYKTMISAITRSLDVLETAY